MYRWNTLLVFCFVWLLSCSETQSGDPPQQPPVVKESPEILSCSLEEYPEAVIEIDNSQNIIRITLPEGSASGMATIHFTLSEGAASEPASGTRIDLSKPQTIYLSNPDGAARKYSVAAAVAPSSDCSLHRLYDPVHYVRGVQSDDSIVFTLPYGADLTAVTLEATLAEDATVTPDLSAPVDLTRSLTLTVTAADGATARAYTVSARTAPQERAVRGVFLPSPSHTASFLTYQSVCASIDLLAELNFNCLFVCGWAQTKTAWDSEVLRANTTYPDARAGNMYARYSGGSGDALHDIIEVAHAKGIRVVLWFEYGFMHGVGGVDTADPLLARHPGWIGRGSDGDYSNYNGTDYYLNAYDPVVQEFMLSLMEEALEKYPALDGIQGDDRLPAMPRNSGYDAVTAALYMADKGTPPPQDFEDPAWVRWRLDRLNGFARTMYGRLKEKKESLIVCFAPNKYPWCETALMQEWPQWIADGAVDLLTVQFYVTYSYEADVRQAMEQVSAQTSRNLLNPAMILKNGNSVLSEQMLVSQLAYNRKMGTCGESQFWFEGLRTDHVQRVFKGFYPGKAEFPR